MLLLDPIKLLSYKDRVILVIRCLKSNALLSARYITLVYNISRTTFI
jgi:hypothetical protein